MNRKIFKRTQRNCRLYNAQAIPIAPKKLGKKSKIRDIREKVIKIIAFKVEDIKSLF